MHFARALLNAVLITLFVSLRVQVYRQDSRVLFVRVAKALGPIGKKQSLWFAVWLCSKVHLDAEAVMLADL